MKKIFLFLLFVLLLSFVSAKIVFKEPSKTYNLGDRIKQEISVVSGKDFEGFLRVVLVCEDKEFLIYHSPIFLEPETERKISLDFKHNTTGSCRFFAFLERDTIAEMAVSDPFQITDLIILELELNKKYFLPKQTLELTGKIYKKSGKPFTGKAELFVFDKNFSVSVVKGEFSFTTKVPENAKSGKNKCIINANDDFGNSGTITLEFDVGSVPSYLVVEVNNDTIIPGETLVITPKLLDQSNSTLKENVSLKIFKQREFLFFEERKLLLEEILPSGNTISFRFDILAEPTDYILEAYSEGIKTRKIIQVLPLEKIEINFTDGTLEIRNVGNVPYKKPVTINLSLGNFSRTILLDLNLKVNETKIFRLEAPKGNYEITFEDGKKIKENLVGEVVAAIELKKENNSKNYFWILVIVAILFIFYFFAKKIYRKSKRKSLKGGLYLKVEKKEKPKIKEEKMPVQLFFGETPSEESAMKKIFSKNSFDFGMPYIEEAKLAGVQKKQASVVCCNFRNLHELENLRKKNSIQFERIANNFFNSIIKIITNYRGTAKYEGSEILVLLLESDQELPAVKIANELRAFVDKFNEELKKEELALEISCGFGVHSGLLAFHKGDKIIRYEESDTTKIARGLSRKALKGEVLISSPAYMKISSLINAKRITPLYIDEKKAIECFLLQHPAPSEIKSLHESRVRKFLESIS